MTLQELSKAITELEALFCCELKLDIKNDSGVWSALLTVSFPDSGIGLTAVHPGIFLELAVKNCLTLTRKTLESRAKQQRSIAC